MSSSAKKAVVLQTLTRLRNELQHHMEKGELRDWLLTQLTMLEWTFLTDLDDEPDHESVH